MKRIKKFKDLILKLKKVYKIKINLIKICINLQKIVKCKFEVFKMNLKKKEKKQKN